MFVSVAGVAVFSLLIGALSALGVLGPSKLIRFIRQAMPTWGYPAAILTRLVLAAALWFAAAHSKTPLAFQFLAILALAGALMMQWMGRERIIALMDGVAQWPLWGLRLWCSLGIGLALFLAWSINPL